MTAEMPAPSTAQPLKARVFISYSRKDIAFTDRLEAALEDRGFEPLIDRSEIYAFEEWWTRIQVLITRADTVVFVLSPDSVASDVALKEVTFAASLNKRFAPIVCRRVSDAAVPEALAKLNFVFFDDPARFDTSADRLAEALDTDIDWIRPHTEFGEQTRRWAVAGRSGGLLLRSPVLEEAERWIASRPQNAPAPTVDTQTFITRSRRAATRRRNILTGSLAAGLLLAIALAGTAYWQRTIAEQQKNIAVANERRAITGEEQAKRNEALAKEQRDRALRTQSLLLADQAGQRINTGDSGTGVLLALTGLSDPTAGVQRPYVVEAEAALFRAAYGLREIKVFDGHSDELSTALFSSDGRRIATASNDRTAKIWDAETGQILATLSGHDAGINCAVFNAEGRLVVTPSNDNTARVWDAETGKQLLTFVNHSNSVNSAQFSPDGKFVITASSDKRAIIWEAASGRIIKEFLHETHVRKAMFSPNGRYVLTADDAQKLRIWDVKSGAVTAVLEGHTHNILGIAFSPDGSKIASASADTTSRIWDVKTGKVVRVGKDRPNLRGPALSNP